MSAAHLAFPEPPPPQSSGLAVLSVSGQEEDHRELSRILCQDGWQLLVANGIGEALERLRTEPAAMVICDRDLPDGTWKNLLEQLSLQEFPPPLVVTSRIADNYLWAEGLNLGAFDVLAKPFEPREVRWAVDSAANHREHSPAPEPVLV